MSEQEIEIARQNLTSALRPAVGSVPTQREIMLAIEDLVRAYLVTHLEFTAHPSLPAATPVGPVREHEGTTDA